MSVRKKTLELLELVHSGSVDKDQLIRDLLNWMSEADVAEFVDAGGYATCKFCSQNCGDECDEALAQAEEDEECVYCEGTGVDGDGEDCLWCADDWGSIGPPS